jgi:hypothetical protein
MAADLVADGLPAGRIGSLGREHSRNNQSHQSCHARALRKSVKYGTKWQSVRQLRVI